jgi:elongation factor Ts
MERRSKAKEDWKIMTISAANVKRLRDETDAPMMDCKLALEEAGGDFERAKEILREKGKAAAAKRAGRTTAEGVAWFEVSADAKSAGGVVLVCETDFVAKNEDFVNAAKVIATALVAQDPGSDPSAIQLDGKTAGDLVHEMVGKIRENIQIAQAVHLTGTGVFGAYVHHDRKIAVAVEMEGTATNLQEIAHKIGVQCAWSAPRFLTKEEIPQEFMDSEIEIETQRAINEGKDPAIAKNIAMGRFNKEIVKQQVLTEQMFYADNTKTVAQYLQEAGKEGGGTAVVKRFVRLSVSME